MRGQRSSSQAGSGGGAAVQPRKVGTTVPMALPSGGLGACTNSTTGTYCWKHNRHLQRGNEKRRGKRDTVSIADETATAPCGAGSRCASGWATHADTGTQ
jgi:hypothetical protein